MTVNGTMPSRPKQPEQVNGIDNSYEPVPFGRPMREAHFLFDPTFLNLNHGSFGAHPKSVQHRLEEVARANVARPDIFTRYEYPDLLDQNREALAKYLKVPSDEIVLVQNASAATNTVLRNLKFSEGDAILSFSTAYGAVTKTIESLKETTPVSAFQAKVTYPLSDEEVVAKFHELIKQCKDAGKKPLIAIFDSVSSMPGVYVPWERLVGICKDEGILSFVDAAHGVGQVEIDIAGASPDFLTSNLHKWLFTPRASAVFYAAKRNQHLIRTTYPTSHGFKPFKASDSEIFDPMPKGRPKSDFVRLFEFVATADNSPYLCIDEALRFREEVCGGDRKIKEYAWSLASKAAKRAAEVWGTEIIETDRVRECAMVNARLPIKVKTSADEVGDVTLEEAHEAVHWISEILVREYNAFAAIFVHGGKMWVRLSGQIYLDLEDFERGIEMLSAICGRIRDGSWKIKK